MSLLDQISSTKRKRPRRVVIMGGPGWGKSTLAATRTPNPVFVPTEDGLADIEAKAFPLAKTLADAWGPLFELGGGGHDFKTVVIDSGDWLEKLIHDAICSASGVESIADIDFGKGYAAAAAKFTEYLRSIDHLVDRGMHAVIIVHASIQKFMPPDGESYDRYVPKLHMNAKGEGVGAHLFEWADEVFFCTYEQFTRKEDEGFGQKRNVAIGEGRRIINTCERPGWLSKNRLGLPPRITLDQFSEIFA